MNRKTLAEEKVFGENFVIIRRKYVHEGDKMNKKILAEEKVFGNNFVIIRRKYVPENDDKRNIFDLFNKEE